MGWVVIETRAASGGPRWAGIMAHAQKIAADSAANRFFRSQNHGATGGYQGGGEISFGIFDLAYPWWAFGPGQNTFEDF